MEIENTTSFGFGLFLILFTSLACLSYLFVEDSYNPIKIFAILMFMFAGCLMFSKSLKEEK
jgi:predicted membrane channel-forming protein YqfA (hemolysin III family)